MPDLHLNCLPPLWESQGSGLGEGRGGREWGRWRGGGGGVVHFAFDLVCSMVCFLPVLELQACG